jgi:hypothetical protein
MEWGIAKNFPFNVPLSQFLYSNFSFYNYLVKDKLEVL